MDERTAQGATDEGQTVFRLRSLTEFRDGPIPSSPVTGWPPEGALVTVKADAGLFLYVLTADGRLGYIRDTAPVTLVQGPATTAASDLEQERSRRRDALVVLGEVQAEAERAKQEPADPNVSPSMAGVVAATIGLVGLLAAHAISGMTNVELMVFFGLDILLPLVVLTANPKAPLIVFQAVVALYLAAVAGYATI